MWEEGRCSPLQVRYKKWGPLAHSKYVVVIINNGYRVLKSTRSTLSRSGYRIFQKGGLDPRYSGVELERERGGGGGGGGTYVPGRRVEGGRNRREIINYRVNERTHGQIQGAVVNLTRLFI